MGFHMTLAVRENYNGSGAKRNVMFVLASYMSDKSGRCFPSIETIARGARISPRQATRLISQLVDEGTLTVIGNRKGGKKGATNTYQLNSKIFSKKGDKDDSFGDLGMSLLTGTPVSNDSQIINENLKSNVQLHIHVKQQAVTNLDVNVIDLNIPYQTIVDLYHELLPDNPQVAKLTDKRKDLIKERWNQKLIMGAGPCNNIRYWKEYFEYVATLDFLTGYSPDSRDKYFRANFDWLFNEDNFTKVIEGFYDRRLI